MMANGSWWLESKSDPRWNINGTGSVGMFGMPSACREKLEELRAIYGEAPADLSYGYMKD